MRKTASIVKEQGFELLTGTYPYPCQGVTGGIEMFAT
jgi:hypothetical protein